MRASLASAISSARSGVSVTKALSGRAASIALIMASVSSRAEMRLSFTASRASASVRCESEVGNVMTYSTTFGTT